MYLIEQRLSNRICSVLKMALANFHSPTMLLVTLVLVSGTSDNDFGSDYDTFTADPYQFEDEEYIRQVYSMYNSYRGEGGPLVIETNALINTKYRTWKRNADIINSLLALPKGMNDAGR